MNVVILHQHFKCPQRGGAVRSYYLARALVEQGHSVRVVTAENADAYHSEELDGIDVHYLPVRYENRFGFIKRTHSFLNFIAGVIRRPKLFKDAHLIYTISVPLTVGIAALWLKKIYKLPYIFEVGDLWPEAPIQMGFIRNSMFKRILFWLEKRIYAEASSIVALSPSIRKNIEERFKNKVIHLIPNMADIDFFKPSVKHPDLEEKYKVKNTFVVSYIGAIGLANGLDYVLQCANVSQRSALPLKFMICGNGAMLSELKNAAKKMNLANLLFIPFQNRDGVNEIMKISDAIFVCYKPVAILETGSPNKYFDGLSAGKLIVINFGGWIRKEIEENKCGIYVDPHDPDDFLKKIEPFILNRAQLEAFQQSSRRLAEKSYSRKILGEKFVSIVTSKDSKAT